MFQGMAVAHQRKSLFFKGVCRRGVEKCSDNLMDDVVGYRLFSRLTSPHIVVILATMYPRTVKVRSTNGTVNEYIRVVEAFREDGKVKQRVVADVGRKDLLVQVLPKLQRLLAGDQLLDTADLPEPSVLDASTWGPILAIRTLFNNSASGKSSTNRLGDPKTFHLLTGHLCSWPTASSVLAVSTGWPAG
jgi:hypothetical protein